jgi:hypothetical protein
MVLHSPLSRRKRVRVRGGKLDFMGTVAPSSGLWPPSPSGRRAKRNIGTNQVELLYGSSGSYHLLPALCGLWQSSRVKLDTRAFVGKGKLREEMLEMAAKKRFRIRDSQDSLQK